MRGRANRIGRIWCMLCSYVEDDEEEEEEENAVDDYLLHICISGFSGYTERAKLDFFLFSSACQSSCYEGSGRPEITNSQ